MGTKVTVNTITAGHGAAGDINANDTTLANAFDNTLSLDGTTPNSMTADIDLNSNDLLNVKTVNTVNILLNGVSVTLSNLASATASQIANVPAGNIIATDVQAAIDELDTQMTTNDSLDLKIASNLSDVNNAFTSVNNINASYTVVDKAAALLLTPVEGQIIFLTSEDGGSFIMRTGAAIGTYSDNGNSFTGTKFTSGDGSSGFERIYEGSVNVKWFGAKGDDTTDDSLAVQTTIDVVGSSATNGGFVYAPKGVYLISEIVIDTFNVMVTGDTPGYTYNWNYADGTTFKCTTGKYAFHLKYTADSNQGGGIRNCIIRSTENDSTNVEYGVLITSAVTVMTDVSVIGFKNGISGMSWVQNVFTRVGITWNTRVGLALVNVKETSFTHPNVTTELADAVTSGGTSTRWTMRDCNIRRNYVGMVIRDGYGASISDTVIESNRHAGVMMFRSANATTQSTAGPMFYHFNNCHFESNYRRTSSTDWTTWDSTQYSLSTLPVEACRTSLTEYFKGSVSGQWTSTSSSTTSDTGWHIWMGSEIEADPQGAAWGLIANDVSSKELPAFNVFENCSFFLPYSIKIRSGWQNKLINCRYFYGRGDGITPSTPIYTVSLGTLAYDTLIKGGMSRVDNLASATGTRTIIERLSGLVTGETSGKLIEKGDYKVMDDVLVRRVLSSGTTIVGGDLALSSGWGTTASLGTPIGTDMAWQVDIIASGTGMTNAPTLTLTFANGAFANPPLSIASLELGNDYTIAMTSSTTTTTVVLTYQGTPIARTYTVRCHITGR